MSEISKEAIAAGDELLAKLICWMDHPATPATVTVEDLKHDKLYRESFHRRFQKAINAATQVQKRAPVAGCVAEVREDVFFITDGSGLGKLANSRMSAHQWLDAMLDGLKTGDGTGDTDFMEEVKFEYRAMTKAEIDAMPEV